MAVAFLIPAAEAAHPDSAVRRAAAGHQAGREVAASVDTLERRAMATLLQRLQQLKRELQGVLAAGGSDFRRFTAQTLIADVDRLIADATRDITQGTRSVFAGASDLGVASVEEPIKGARIALTPAPRVDATLVTQAYELTGDLLSAPMQQFRTQVVTGIRRAALTGDSSSAQLQQLATSIDTAGFDQAQFRAERIVRTELSRVLNSATYARLEQLAQQMPFLRKGWRSSKDARVRLGHQEAAKTYARGAGIPIAQPYQVNVYRELPGKPPRLLGQATLRFPVDPLAGPSGPLAKGATIMCRCSAFTDFNLADLRAWSTSRSQGVTPGAPILQRGEPLGFPEPPIAPPRRVPTATRPIVPKGPAPAPDLARREPVRSPIPGGRELLSPYPEAIQRALEDAHRDLFTASRFDSAQPSRFREVLQVINADASRGALYLGDKDSVTITPEMARELRGAVAWIHTHPSSSAFSLADAYQLARFNGPTMLVYGRSGSWYELIAPPEFSLTHRAFGDAGWQQFQVDHYQEFMRAHVHAKVRTDQAVREQARQHGVSLMQAIANAQQSPDIQDLHLLHVQEESVEAWQRLSARWHLQFRFHLPPAPTTGTKHRSREALGVADGVAEALRGGGSIDDWEVSAAAVRYGGPQPSPIVRFLRAALKARGIEVDAATGERRHSASPDAGQ